MCDPAECYYQTILFRLYPKKDQQILLSKTVGSARFVYNRYLAQKIRYYEKHKHIEGKNRKCLSNKRCMRRLTLLKQKEEYKWLREVDSTALQQSLNDLDRAYRNFFKGAAHPKFHKKGQKESFRCVMGLSYDPDSSSLKIGKNGWIKARGSWNVFLDGLQKIQSITVRKDSDGKWYASVMFKTENRKLDPARHQICGIDVGVKRPLQVCGVTYGGEEKFAVYGREVKRQLERLECRRKRYQRRYSRCQSGSSNQSKARKKLGKAFWREQQIRKNWQEQTSFKLSTTYNVIALENLNIKAMTRSAKGNLQNPGKNVKAKSGLNRELLRLGFSRFITRLEHKVLQREGTVVFVPAHHTSQECSACGFVSKTNRKTQSKFECGQCGHTENADRNAARNIRQRVLA